MFTCKCILEQESLGFEIVSKNFLGGNWPWRGGGGGGGFPRFPRMKPYPGDDLPASLSLSLARKLQGRNSPHVHHLMESHLHSYAAAVDDQGGECTSLVPPRQTLSCSCEIKKKSGVWRPGQVAMSVSSGSVCTLPVDLIPRERRNGPTNNGYAK